MLLSPTQNGINDINTLICRWPEWKANYAGFISTMYSQLPNLFYRMEDTYQSLSQNQHPLQQAAHAGQPAASTFSHPPAALQPPEYIPQMVHGVAGGSAPAAVGYPQHPPPAQPPTYHQPSPQQASLPPALPLPSAAAYVPLPNLWVASRWFEWMTRVALASEAHMRWESLCFSSGSDGTQLGKPSSGGERRHAKRGPDAGGDDAY
jgi:hypothetical protein